MSLYVMCPAIKVKDLAAFEAAIKEIFGPTAALEQHAEPQTLYGYHGDARPERAHLIVRRRFISRVANDIGFLRLADGTYQPIVSQNELATHRALMTRVVTLTGVHAALLAARRQGFAAQRRVVAGKHQVVVQTR